MEQISFLRSTFVVQIHGLPPIFLHEGTARQLGNLIGELDKNSFSRKVVVSELGYVGSKFTWKNDHVTGGLIRERLD